MAEEIPLKPARGGLALPIDWEALKQAALVGVDFRTLAIQFRLFDKHGKPNTNAIRQRAYREAWPIAARIVRGARKNLKEAMQEAHKQGQGYHNPPRPSPPYNTNTDRRERGTEGEQGNEKDGNKAMLQGSPNHDSGEGTPENGDSGEGWNKETGMASGSMGTELMGGNEGMNASSPLQTSESLAATLISNHMATLANESIMQALQRAHASIHAAPQSLPIATIADLRSAMKLAQEATGLDKTTNNTQLNILVHPTPKQGSWNFSNESQLPAIDLE